MTEQIEDGGPAFAQEQWNPDREMFMVTGGMSMRDYFAAKAMQGLLAQSCGTALGSDPIQGAQYAYAMADAMLKARESA